MAYKQSDGTRNFGDIKYEGDADETQIDFEDDFVALKTGGNQVLVVSGSQVGIGTSIPDHLLTLNAAADGDGCFIQFKEGEADRAKIGINTSNNLLFHNQYTNKHIVFKVNDQGQTREGLRIDGAVPEVVVNEGSESLVDFRVESNNQTHMLFVDGGNDKVGIKTNMPEVALDIDSDAIRIRNDNTPSSASDFGHKGEIRWDENYVYVCVATDTWKRSPLSSW